MCCDFVRWHCRDKNQGLAIASPDTLLSFDLFLFCSHFLCCATLLIIGDKVFPEFVCCQHRNLFLVKCQITHHNIFALQDPCLQ